MGFEAPETLYRLTWEDPAMAGLEVTIREPDIGQLMSMGGVKAPAAGSADPAQLGPIFEIFAGLLDSWNVERKGVPVPATYEGVMSLSPGFVYKIIEALNRQLRPDPTSPGGSPGGGTNPLEGSIPMEPVSPPS
jgi:hypothetical protein